eukprot:CAMPEP_0171372494 /NCGR_PEP_ID=MMETSP0879-20121228/10101_1 /TAXON_ID=67004 /ORGANISM="Thalassiosira weissflogii, Strain CCMP1336" /LENGTH=44 /DNA_ID= /DNA_START= /DNA_END= /DNA_ORIENTATION=
MDKVCHGACSEACGFSDGGGPIVTRRLGDMNEDVILVVLGEEAA